MRQDEAQERRRRALIAAALVTAAIGCSRPPASVGTAPAAAPLPAPSPAKLAADAGGGAPSAAPAPDIRIDSFDCFKAGGSPEEVDWTPIGAWHGGGPGGASWNVTDLQCVGAVISTCRDGDVASELRIGRTLVARHTGTLGAAGRTEWRFKVRETQWAKNLDDAHGAQRAPYRTAIFRLTSVLTCRKPYELSPGIGPRAEFTADRTFLAGFASGE
jgi:hypothetical protein